VNHAQDRPFRPVSVVSRVGHLRRLRGR